MRGTYLRGVELAGRSGEPGLVLRPRRRALVRPLVLSLAGLVSMALELHAGRGALGALFFALSVAVLALGARAGLDSWSFDGAHAVRRTFAPASLGFREVRLGAGELRRVGYVDRGRASRAWLETQAGDEYALLEGDLPRVQQVAEAWASAARVSAAAVRAPAGGRDRRSLH